MYLTDYGNTLLWFLLVGIAELGVKDGDLKVDETISL